MTHITCLDDLEKTCYACHASMIDEKQGTLALLPGSSSQDVFCIDDWQIDMCLRTCDLTDTHSVKTRSGASVLVSSRWFGVHRIHEIVELDTCTLLLL